jgi:Bacterial Ig-like domain (group 3)
MTFWGTGRKFGVWGRILIRPDAGIALKRAPPDTIEIYVNANRRKGFWLGAILEQVYVRGNHRRVLRLEFLVGLGMVLALLPAAARAQQIATQTTLNVATRDLNGRTQATAAITVAGADGSPASGVVTLEDGRRIVGQAALNSDGQASPVVSLAAGAHALHAVYSGDASHVGSRSFTANVTGTTSATPNFAVSLAPVAPSTLPLTLTGGDAGTIAVTITPEDNSALTAPMFVTLSCSGLPSLSSCTFTPETLEILPTTPASCPSGSPVASCPPVSSMLIQTQGQGTSKAIQPAPAGRRSSPVAWAILVPGMLGLGGLAWGARRRKWLQRLALMGLIGLVTTLGTTACSPLYYYYHHGPTPTPSTPTGTFNVTITAQSNNGVTAITNSTTMVLTVQ